MASKIEVWKAKYPLPATANQYETLGVLAWRESNAHRSAIEAIPTKARTERIHIQVPVLGLPTYRLVSSIHNAEGMRMIRKMA